MFPRTGPGYAPTGSRRPSPSPATKPDTASAAAQPADGHQRSTRSPTATDTPSNAASATSNTTAASPPATTSSPSATPPPSTSPAIDHWLRRSLSKQLTAIEAMTSSDVAAVDHRITIVTLQSVAARIRFLTGQLHDIDPELEQLITAHPAGPQLLAEPGVGPVVAAQVLISWSHPGRVRSEAAFASLAGVAPLEASSGQRSRHRLNRGGDRALNRTLHTVAVTRMRCHPESRAYETRRTLQGKTHRDIRRCLKRSIARRLYRLMESSARANPALTTA